MSLDADLEIGFGTSLAVYTKEYVTFDGVCPVCGAKMEKKLTASGENGGKMGLYMCTQCDEDTALWNSVWVHEDGPRKGYVADK